MREPLCGIQEYLPDQVICRRGDRVSGCWLVLGGRVEIRAGDRSVTFRGEDEIFGEQGLLHFLAGKNGSRTADVKAIGPVRLFFIDAAFQQRLTDPENTIWVLTLADVVNMKLAQATEGRSELRNSVAEQEHLLRRFSDGDALGLVKVAAAGQNPPIQNRKAVVFFSDIANFSVWSAGKDSGEVASHLHRLCSLQIDLIRKAGGQIDKLMGDGVMAYWFIDTTERERIEPAAVIRCATTIAEEIGRYVTDNQLDVGIRIGLHAGDVAFGDFGAEQRIAVTVLGATVNMAARYEQAKSAELGQVRVSPDLRDLALRAGIAPETFRGPVKASVKHGVELDVYSF
ncbi:cyclic nucleotide-binding domain-containing protein [Bradyrhizobium sp. SBR1B]|uniref:cyclic nucleotide-binding domain-containing protein n=1 Tax=Bradyrhizobium sp. SBR1B TaxID=2663836 RepID=UPI00179DF14A|nr:adenylate/guanylate cyclase domain-containing protein [Bradyrhizobium sp. SBR1B]MBB4376379.1 class 3 adenylate cyclase [Bradyrhizobium sp. SBR1B]